MPNGSRNYTGRKFHIQSEWLRREMFCWSSVSEDVGVSLSVFAILCSYVLEIQKKENVMQCSGAVFTNHSLERSLSYSPDFSIFRTI